MYINYKAYSNDDTTPRKYPVSSKEYNRYKKYLLSKWRRKIFDRDDNRCRYCKSDERLQLAHITDCPIFLNAYQRKIGWRKALRLSFRGDNLVCLCNKCHASYHKYVKDIDNGNTQRGKDVFRLFSQLKKERKWTTIKQLDWNYLWILYKGYRKKEFVMVVNAKEIADRKEKTMVMLKELAGKRAEKYANEGN